MTTRFVMLLSLIVVFGAAAADLPTRAELLERRYEADRAKGLTILNRKYIEEYQKELDLATKAGRLDEANAIRARLEKLQAELAKLTETVAAIDAAMRAGNENLLEGKTAKFKHPNQEFTINVEFGEDREAIWIGLGNVAVEWAYEKADDPLVYYFWPPARETKQTGWIIKIDPNGKAAAITNLATKYQASATLGKTRGR